VHRHKHLGDLKELNEAVFPQCRVIAPFLFHPQLSVPNFVVPPALLPFANEQQISNIHHAAFTTSISR
jgi:hypothetical protein